MRRCPAAQQQPRGMRGWPPRITTPHRHSRGSGLWESLTDVPGLQLRDLARGGLDDALV